MSETIAAFGDVKPSEDHETRRTQLSKLIRKGKDPFEEQDSQWYEFEEENLNRMVQIQPCESQRPRETRLTPCGRATVASVRREHAVD